MKEFEQKAQAWLDGDFDQETKIRIIQLRNSDPAAYEDAFYKNLEFGTGGLRGIMGPATTARNSPASPPTCSPPTASMSTSSTTSVRRPK